MQLSYAQMTSRKEVKGERHMCIFNHDQGFR